MPESDALEAELKELVVKSLALEDVVPEGISSGAPLFVDGLGLDSIDALELAMVVSRKYGVKMDAKAADYRKHFASIRSLARFIDSQKKTRDKRT